MRFGSTLEHFTPFLRSIFKQSSVRNVLLEARRKDYSLNLMISIVVDVYYAVMKEGLSLYEDSAVDSRSATTLVLEWTESNYINGRNE